MACGVRGSGICCKASTAEQDVAIHRHLPSQEATYHSGSRYGPHVSVSIFGYYFSKSEYFMSIFNDLRRGGRRLVTGSILVLPRVPS